MPSLVYSWKFGVATRERRTVVKALEIKGPPHWKFPPKILEPGDG